MSDESSELSRDDILSRYNPSSVAEKTTERRSPFKFLDSYDVNDRDIFFGRDYEIQELQWHFHSRGHVVIYGESGCGKSSLVQCGLRSRIPESDALFIPPRLHTTGLPAVCREICEAVARDLGQPPVDSADLELVDTLRAACEAISRPIVLFFDQFEELFIFHDAEIRLRFAEDLSAMLTDKMNVKVIIGIRQDYLAHLSELEDIVEGLFNNRFWLRRMSRENASQAVQQACESCGVRVDAKSVDAVVARLDPSGQGMELPYLQVVMDRLYRQAVAENSENPEITAAAVEQLGEIGDILGTFLVEEVEKMPSPETGRQILKAFVSREGTRRTLERDAILAEAASFGESIPSEDLEPHVNQLVSSRILREVPDTTSYELRHDSLAATVSGWISEVEKELIDVRDNLANRFQEYEARGKPDSALLDEGFMDYLAVYRQRLMPLLDDAQRRYLETSQRHILSEKRKKQLIIGGCVAAVVFLGLVGLTFYVVSVTKARNEAVRNEKEAVRQRDRAEKNFAMARDAVEKYFTRISEDALLNEPGMQELRNDLLAEAIDFNTKFVAQHKDDPELQDELARAFFNIGRITDDIGQPKKALVHFEQCRNIYEKLLQSDSSDTQVLAGLASAWNATGKVQHKSGKPDEALAAYNKAIEIRQKLVDKDPDNVEYIRLIANAHMNIGAIELLRGKNDEALQSMNKAQEIRQPHVEKDVKIRRDFGMGDYNLANLFIDLEQWGNVNKHLARATKTFTQLVDDNPEVIEYQYQLAACYRLRGDAAEKTADIIREYEEARKRFESLVRNNPLVGRYRLELARTAIELGAIQFEEEHFDEAKSQYILAVKEIEYLLERQPTVPVYRDNLARSLQDLTNLLVTQKDWPAATRSLDRSIEFWTGLVKEFPKDQYYAEALRETEAIRGKIPKNDE